MPSRVLRTVASTSRQTTTSGLAETASAAVAARVAPRVSSSGERPGVRFQTVVGWPAARKARARAVPIAPRPRTVTGVFMRTSLVRRFRMDKYPLISQVLTER
jgi:hypothetical protein